MSESREQCEGGEGLSLEESLRKGELAHAQTAAIITSTELRLLRLAEV